MEGSKINILEHYRKLWFFNFHRSEGDNYKELREYYAEMLITEIEGFMPLREKKVLDVGGAKGEFCKVLTEKRMCDSINLDPAPYEHGRYSGDFIWPKTIIGSADKIPFDDNEFDIVICRGVLEHVPKEKQQHCINEMFRTVKSGGLCYIMIPPWYNFHAGHQLKPFHILPFKPAKFLRQLLFRNRIDARSLAEMGLYPITFKRMLKLIDRSGFNLRDTKDVHFRMHFLTRIPLVREVAVPSVAFILVKK